MEKTKRQYARYRLQNLENAFVVFPPLKGHEKIVRPLFNLSYKGIGFHPGKGDETNLPIGEELPAQLTLGKEEIPIRLEMLYHTAELSGARIKPEKTHDIRKIIRFISPMELGTSLKPVDPTIVRQTDLRRLLTWYIGKNNTELVLWRSPDGELLEFRLVFFLYAITGDIAQGKLITADLNPTELGYMPIHEPWPEQAAHWHEKPNREALQLAVELLGNATSLSSNDQEEISAWVLGAYPR